MTTPFQKAMQEIALRVSAVPGLVGGLNQGGLMDKFAAEFGNRWKKTPVNGVFYVAGKTKNIQFTVRWIGGRTGWDVAYYDFKDAAEFKDIFENNKGALAGNAEYFSLEEGDKYSALGLIRFLEKRGVQWH